MNLLAVGTLTLGIPFTILGLILKKFPPKNINNWVGYRTPSSKKNADTWAVANSYSTNLMTLIGFFLVILGLISFVLPDMGISGLFIGEGIGLGLVVAMIVSTEMHLNKLFDKNGNRKPVE